MAICKNCGHELYENEDDEGNITYLHENAGWNMYLKECHVEHCGCIKPEPEGD